MKVITQAVFEGAPKWVKSARIDKKGKLIFYSLGKDLITRILGNQTLLPFNAVIAGSDYDTTDWQNSAIDRPLKDCSL